MSVYKALCEDLRAIDPVKFDEYQERRKLIESRNMWRVVAIAVTIEFFAGCDIKHIPDGKNDLIVHFGIPSTKGAPHG